MTTKKATVKKKAGNASFTKAKDAKQDEFYTQLTDIERELKHYKKHFKNKVVLCNCDDPRVSQFFHYFTYKFEELGLKKLITTCYKSKHGNSFTNNEDAQGVSLVYTGDQNNSGVPDPEEVGVVPLQGDGDFRSAECIALLKEADIVVTNPPFSLFREYIAQLIEHKKKFIVVGNQNAITYKEIFPLIRDGKIWQGNHAGDMAFRVPDDYEPKATRYWQDETGQKWRSLGNACWYTNLDFKRRHEFIPLYKKFSEAEYPQYDHYRAIEVGKVAEIPIDFKGAMGVPVTFLSKYSPDQFEILDANNYRKSKKVMKKPHGLIKDKEGAIGDRIVYARVLIRHRRKAKGE